MKFDEIFSFQNFRSICVAFGFFYAQSNVVRRMRYDLSSSDWIFRGHTDKIVARKNALPFQTMVPIVSYFSLRLIFRLLYFLF